MFLAGDVESGVEHLSKAVAVCSQPQQLLQVLQQTLPPQVFQLMLQRLPVVSQVCVLFCMNWVLRCKFRIINGFKALQNVFGSTECYKDDRWR